VLISVVDSTYMFVAALKAQLAAARFGTRTVKRSFSSTTSTMASPAPMPTKLHGRAFYESLGSPKMILAPMVDRSEFVSPVPYSDEDSC
jgi:hypothetical protein